MTIDEAREVVMGDKTVSAGRLMRATWELCNPDNQDSVSVGDVLTCLIRGQKCTETTQILEIAALTLYSRTGRPRKQGRQPYEDFVTDPDDWRQYLVQHKFIVADAGSADPLPG